MNINNVFFIIIFPFFLSFVLLVGVVDDAGYGGYVKLVCMSQSCEMGAISQYNRRPVNALIFFNVPRCLSLSTLPPIISPNFSKVIHMAKF